MRDQSPQGSLPVVELLELGQAEGFCDPVTGACVLPGPTPDGDAAPGGALREAQA